MKKAIVIMIKELGGGAATLSLRMGVWSLRNSYSVYIFTDRIESQTLMEEIIKAGLKIVTGKYHCYVTAFDSIYEDYTSYTIITHTLVEYIQAQKIKRKYSNIKRTLFYVIHPYSTFYGLPNVKSKKIIMLCSRVLLKKYIYSLYKNGNMIFMDEDCISTTEKFYKLKLEGAYDGICRLPMIIKNYSNTEIELKNKKTPFTILTITRFDFNMKGYVFGLIDCFEKLINECNNIRLKIVGDGNGMLALEKKIDSLEGKCKQHIQIMPFLPYKDLEIVFRQADLFLGMGTTILDAVNNLVPAIILHYYTTDLIASGFFSEHPNILATSSYKDSGCKYIREVISMKRSDYVDLVRKQYVQLKNNYDIEYIMPKILHKNTMRDLPNSKIGYFPIIFIQLRDILSRIKHGN